MARDNAGVLGLPLDLPVPFMFHPERGNQRVFRFGVHALPLPADFDADGNSSAIFKVRPPFYRPSLTGIWMVTRSSVPTVLVM
jgi:hypothetical protein